MDFIELINKSGGEIYLVGGTVRDQLYNYFFNTNKKSKDFDLLCCKLEIKKMEDILRNYGTVKGVGKSFGIITFKPKHGFLAGSNIDIALPRTEKSTGSGYKDFEIVADHNLDISEDLKRRDFTINALAYKLNSENDLKNLNITPDNVIDYNNGVDDLKNMTLKAVGCPHKRMLEDPTRIMRALRQISQLDLVLDKQLKDAIIKYDSLINIILETSPSRICEELCRLLLSDNCINCFKFIILETSIPKIIELNINDNNLMIKQMGCAINNKLPLYIKMAILLQHTDINKWVKKYNLSSAPHYPKKDIKFLQQSQYIKNICSDKSEYNVRKFIQLVDKLHDQNIFDYYDLYKCIYGDDNELHNIITDNKDIPRSTSDLKISGDEINKPGKEIGIIKLWLLDEINKSNVTNDKNMLYYYFKNYK